MAIIEGEGTVRPASAIIGALSGPRPDPQLSVKLLHPDAVIPTRAHPTDAGLDLYAVESTTLYAGPSNPTVVKTGIAVAIPPGLVGLVFVRSSIGFKKNVTLANSVGVIDSDYRGEIKVALTNNSNNWCRIAKGERFAQLVLVPVALMSPKLVTELPETVRGDGGIGSTGS